MDDDRIFKTPCPFCGKARVCEWSYGPDCSSPSSGYGITCLECHHKFEPEVWRAIAKREYPAKRR